MFFVWCCLFNVKNEVVVIVVVEFGDGAFVVFFVYYINECKIMCFVSFVVDGDVNVCNRVEWLE